MHYRNVVCLLSCSLFLSSAWGCRLDEPEHNIYQKQGKGVVYLRPYEKTNLSLPQINYKRLRLLPNLLIDPTKLEDWETVPPATNLMTDVVYSGANATLPHYSYYSDGRAILYAGEIVQNPRAHRQSISRHFRHGVILPQISTASITKANAPIATSN